VHDDDPRRGLRTLARTVRFPGRFVGALPGSANGGVIAGTLAQALDGDRPTQVRIERPVPLDTDLTLRPAGDALLLLDDELVLARATQDGTAPTPIAAVSVAAAQRTSPVLAADAHPAPGCFVCGPAHPAGLDLQPGWVGDRPVVATVWEPPGDLADADGVVPEPIVWAALDCPSWYGAAAGRPALLGSVLGRQLAPVAVGVPLVVAGWRIGAHDRTTTAGSALFSTDGDLLAVATCTWIHPKEHHR
jgi:hypothetical protein